MIYLDIEQLVAGALYYGFDEIKAHTLPLLIKDFLEKNPNCAFIGIKDVNQIPRISHINLNGELYSVINNKKIKEAFSDKKTAKLELKTIAGFRVIDYFHDFDLTTFLLEKIERLDYEYGSSEERELFSDFEINELRKLIKKGYLMKIDSTYSIINNFKTAITELGQAKLYISRHKKEIECFIERLSSKRYVSSHLEEFLADQDLSKDPQMILTCDRFVEFCKRNKKEIFLPGTTKVSFNRVKNLSKNINIDRLITIYDQNHSIVLCHPDEAFNGKSIISLENHEIESISWNDISSKKVSKYGKEYHKKETLLNGIKYSLNKQIHKGNVPSAYITILEVYYYRGETNYLVRGLIKKKDRNFYVAFNPAYEDSIPNNHIETSARMNGNYTPGIYLVKSLNNK